MQAIDLNSCNLKINVYQLHTDGAGAEEVDDDNLIAASHWLMPSSDFEGLWESLVYDEPIKMRVCIHLTFCIFWSTKIFFL